MRRSLAPSLVAGMARRWAAISLVALGLACGDAAPERGGVLVIVWSRTPWPSEPLRPGSENVSWAIQHFYREPLLRVDDDGRLQPVLAAEVRISDGGRRMTLPLRPGAVFASGRPVRAVDVVASYHAWATPGAATIEAVDDATVRLQLAAPMASLAIQLEDVFVGPAEQMAPEPLASPLTALDGSGPFRIAAARLRQGEIVFVRNPRAAKPARLDGMVLRMDEAKTAEWELMQLLAGEADIVWFMSHPQLVAVQGVPHLRCVDRPKPVVVGLGYRCSDPRLSDARVRRALNLAVDRAAVLRSLGESFEPAGGLLGDPGRYDPREAARLLDEAGWKMGADGVRRRDGLRLALRAGEIEPARYRVMAAALAPALQEVGVELEDVVSLVWGAGQGGVELFSVAFFLAPLPLAFDAFRPEGTTRFWDYGDCRTPATQAAVAEADAATSAEGLQRAFEHLGSAIAESPPALLLYRSSSDWMCLDARLAGIEHFVPGIFYDQLWVHPQQRLPRDDLRYWLERAVH